MRKLSDEKSQIIIQVVGAIENIISRRQLDKAFHRDEVEFLFFSLIQGKDLIDPYERRDSGVSDIEWENMVHSMNELLGLTEESKRRINEVSLFD